MDQRIKKWFITDMILANLCLAVFCLVTTQTTLYFFEIKILGINFFSRFLAPVGRFNPVGQVFYLVNLT